MTSDLRREHLLPPLAVLVEAPQLSSLALLELALVVVPRDLDLHEPHLGALYDLIDDAPDNLTTALLAQLISDRCRELAELTAAYRHSLATADSAERYDEELPF
jgi:hypothetical protein